MAPQEQKNAEEKRTEALQTLSWFYEATRIPVSVFNEKRLIHYCGGETSNLNFPMFLQIQLPEDLPDVWTSTVDRNVLFGGIQGTNNLQLLFGPILPGPCSQAQARRLISMLGRSQQDVFTLISYFQECGEISENQLRSALLLFVRLFPITGIPAGSIETASVRITYHPPFPTQQEIMKTPYSREDFEKEQRTMSYIAHGNTAPFEAMLEQPIRTPGREIPPIQLMRQYLSSAITLASRTAISAGVSYDLAYGIAGDLMEELTHAATLEDIQAFYPQAFLPFAREVKRIREHQPDDALCRKVHQYICGHLFEKTSASDIAEALGYNLSYLSAHFRKTMNRTLTEYIHLRKIDEAKDLLRETDASYSEIALRLGYPSQSYFGKIFSEHTGMTPKAYRKEGKQGYRRA